MDAADIHINDWQRIFVGNVPGTFYIEILARLVVLYLLLLGSMRAMGKRVSAKLTKNELAAIVVLAAAIGVPVQTPDRGILPAVIISMVVVITEKTISSLAFKSQPFEKYAFGNISTLVVDAVMDLDAMKKAKVSRNRVMAEIRSKSITHMGKVKRLYLEASGQFALIREEAPGPGLSVIPDWDTALKNEQEQEHGMRVCSRCGQAGKQEGEQCANCGANAWAIPIK